MPRGRAIANVVLKARHPFEQIVDRPMDRRERILGATRGHRMGLLQLGEIALEVATRGSHSAR
jgi:hypothetical protein